jgi:hypothetical protein
MLEGDIQKLIAREATKDPKVRVFRNQVGAYRSPDGRFINFGLAKGSSDLIGFKTVTITQDMVGKDIAVFLSIEVKTPKGKLTDEQKHWLQFIKDKGGIAFVARTPHDIHDHLHQF